MSIRALAQEIAPLTTIAPVAVRELLSVLVSLEMTRNSLGESASAIVSAVSAALQRDNALELQAYIWV